MSVRSVHVISFASNTKSKPFSAATHSDIDSRPINLFRIQIGHQSIKNIKKQSVKKWVINNSLERFAKLPRKRRSLWAKLDSNRLQTSAKSEISQIIVYSLYVEMNLYLQQIGALSVLPDLSALSALNHSLYLISITLSSTINDRAVSCCNMAELKSSSSHDVS